MVSGLESGAAIRLAAGAVVDKAASHLALTLDAATREKKVDRIIELFAAPLKFHNSVLRRVVLDGYDLTRRKTANSFWDLHIAFSTSPLAVLDGTRLWLITNDSPVLTAARESGASEVVRSYADYCLVLQDREETFE